MSGLNIFNPKINMNLSLNSMDSRIESHFNSDFVDDELFLVREHTHFCTKENVLNSVAYINQEFQLLGIPCLHLKGAKLNVDVVFFMNRLYDLLTLYHKTKAVKEDLENRNHRLLCDIERQRTANLRLTKNQGESDKDLDEEKEKLRQITQKYKQLCVKLKSEKEEVKRLTAVVQSKDVQYKHEQKKREREVFKLKERLHQLLSDKVPERKVGMDLQNVIGRDEGRRSTWKSSSGKQEEEMYQLIIANYEEKHKELMLENGDLRDCLLSLQKELTRLLKQTGDMSSTSALEPVNQTDAETESGTSSQLVTEFDEGYFQMPYDIIRQEIERNFKETCNQIAENVSRSQSSKTSPNQQNSDLTERRESTQHGDKGELEKLKVQIKKYKAIIKEQEALLQQSLNSQSQSVENTIHLESQLVHMKESLLEQKKMFSQEKVSFEKERHAFKEAVIRFAQERRQLQEEKTNLLKNQLLNMSQCKENQKSSGHSPRLLPSTPVFSSKSPAQSPEDLAAEVYKFIGLSHSSDTIGSSP
ncbi:afadin- and alpha-actinin-binding protein [Biomphalaria pfeifferi]|uniref:Afadin- and alpha-actinin-binding protein n=1 Tax=Biomphalaria pfeifferi TaxID=112525 RepID=A0AAD8AQ26_BIOPF|nr:afadin- and alpha-actinin-binding protein [Biomphalaria pfeifferi]